MEPPRAATPRAGDEVDQRRIRLAWAAVAVVVAGGMGFVLGAAYLEVCRGCDTLDALPLIGILPAWAAALAVAAGRLAWHRSLGAAVAGAVLLGWLALHFLVPAAVGVYAGAFWAVNSLGWQVGFLVYWFLAAVVLVLVLRGIEWVVDEVP